MTIRAYAAEILEARIHGELKKGRLRAIVGTLQRIDYRRQELRVIAQGRVWQFKLAPDCQLWFDDKCVILRCFHPLDHVEIIFAEGRPCHLIRALYSWEKERSE